MDTKAAKSKLEEYKPFFDRLMDQDVILSFGRNVVPIHFLRIEYAKVGALHNTPDKRSMGEKNYTPPVMSLVFTEDTTLDVVIQDISDIKYTLRGVCFTVGDIDYTLELVP